VRLCSGAGEDCSRGQASFGEKSARQGMIFQANGQGAGNLTAPSGCVISSPQDKAIQPPYILFAEKRKVYGIKEK